jgi:nucleoid-associated protein YgaU
MRLLITFGALALATQVATAQSAPTPTKPKQAARNAVAATNAQTRASTGEPAPVYARSQTAPSAPAVAIVKDSAAGTASVAAMPRPGEPFERETFAYDQSGRRDPFVSLMSVDELRPVITDLQIVGIAFDPSGRNSVAVLRDVSSKDKDQYRVRVGQSLGRMRVASIAKKHVVFTIEEFGFSRQEKLLLGDPNQERKQ